MRWPWLLSWQSGERRHRLHWSLPAGALLVAIIGQGTDALIGYFLVLFAHIAGHLLMLRRRGLVLAGVDLHALGGGVRWKGSAPALSGAVVGASGLLGQVLLWWGVLLVILMTDLQAEGSLYTALTSVNLALMLGNLLPITGSDQIAPPSLPSAVVRRLEEKLTDIQRSEWQELIEADQDRNAAIDPTTDILSAMLAERDALADAGIPPEIVSAVDALLAEVWGEE